MPKLMDKQTFQRIEELLLNGWSHTVIALHVDVHGTAVRKIAKGQHFYQQSEEEQKRRLALTRGVQRSLANYVPTPEEIAAACESIQGQKTVAVARKGGDLCR